jgi:catechol 2,3-dioxygenase
MMETPQKFTSQIEVVARLHPATEVGTVSLKVADLTRSLTFYTSQIGLKLLEQEQHRAVLGAGQRPILALEEVSGAQPQPENTTGLYHAAILFPDRHALAVKIAQLTAARTPLGYGDHLVSEAFYLSDPDENGLELYRDRPRREWAWSDSQVRMATDPIDFDSFFSEIKEDEDVASLSPAAPDGTKLGHVHLRVADIPLAEQFYHGVLGFDVTARLPGALFVSAGGYHHHIGMNTWQSRGGKPPVEPSAGLRQFSIILPDLAELEHVVKQVLLAGVTVERDASSATLLDPFQNRIQLIVNDALKNA